MNNSDIEFTMGLDTSPAEQKLSQFQNKMSMADAAFERAVSRNNSSYNVIRNSPNYQGLGFEKFNSYDNPLMNAAKKFESVITVTSEKLRLQAERTSARREYTAAYKTNDMAGMQTASQKLEQAQFGLDQISAKEKEERTKQREITDETKTQNREHTESYIKLSKIHKVLLSILAAWQAIKKAAGFAFDRQGELMKEAGFLTYDPAGAFHANTDKSYAMIMHGLLNMGKAAPFSAGALNEVLTKIQTAKERAMAGQGVDDNLAIAVQQLNDTLGTNFNAVQLLTGDPNRTNVDIVREILDTIEKNLPKIADMDEQTRSRTMHYLRSLIGPELANALMANYNLNLRTGATSTTMEKIESHGGSAVTNYNVAVATREITESFSELKESSKKLGDKFLEIVSEPLSNFAKTLTSYSNLIEVLLEHNKKLLPQPVQNVVDAYEDIVDWFETKGMPVPWSLKGLLYGSKNPNAKGFAKKGLAGTIDDVITPGRGDVDIALSQMGGVNALDTKIKELKKNPKGVADLLNAQIMADPAYRNQFGENYVEGFRKEAQLYKIWKSMPNIRKGNFAGIPTELMPIAQMALIYAGSDEDLKNFSKFQEQIGKHAQVSSQFERLYGPGGKYDINPTDYQLPSQWSTQDLEEQYLNEFLSYAAMKYLQPNSTGGSVKSGWRETKDGKWEFVVRLLNADGKEFKVLSATKPGTESITVSSLQ